MLHPYEIESTNGYRGKLLRNPEHPQSEICFAKLNVMRLQFEMNVLIEIRLLQKLYDYKIIFH